MYAGSTLREVTGENAAVHFASDVAHHGVIIDVSILIATHAAAVPGVFFRCQRRTQVQPPALQRFVLLIDL
jgi:hypothetical protein